MFKQKHQLQKENAPSFDGLTIAVMKEIESAISLKYQNNDRSDVQFPLGWHRISYQQQLMVKQELIKAGYTINSNNDTGQGRSWESMGIK